MSTRRRNYTEEFKLDAVGLVVQNGYSCAEADRRLGINPNNLNRWVRKYRDQRENAVGGERSPKELQAEVQRMRKENGRLECYQIGRYKVRSLTHAKNW